MVAASPTSPEEQSRKTDDRQQAKESDDEEQAAGPSRNDFLSRRFRGAGVAGEANCRYGDALD
jgi:hypothetical protein